MSPLSKKIARFEAELIVGNLSYNGFIENLSEDEVYLVTPLFSLVDFRAETPLELIFQPLPGEIINIPGIIKWSYKTPPHGLTNSLGVKIADHLHRYNNFYRTLQ